MSSIKVYPTKIRGKVEAPPSKSYTHRAVVVSLLTTGRNTIINPLFSKDTKATIEGVEKLGAEVKRTRRKLVVEGIGLPETPEDVINAGNSGTTIRFLTAISGLVRKGYSVLTGDESLRKRPMGPLLKSLKDLGVEAWSTRLNGFPPVIVSGGGITGGETEITGGTSSQFISALLISSVKASEETRILVKDRIVSKPYIEMTLNVLGKYGVKVENEGFKEFMVEPKSEIKGLKFRIPGDFSSISFFLAAAAVSKSNLVVRKLSFTEPQGDMKIIEYLKEMGQNIKVKRNELFFEAGEIEGGKFNLEDTPDLLPVLAVVATKTKKETIIEGVEHARKKESDRIHCLATELAKLGVEISEKRDGLVIKGKEKLKGGVFESYNDHRLFMAFTSLAIGLESGSIIKGKESVDVSYPGFLNEMRRLGAKIIDLNS